MFQRFGRQGFAFSGGNSGWGNWTPPWLQEEGHYMRGPRGPMGGRFFFNRRFGGRGFFGPGGPFRHEGPFGEGRRFFGRGDLKYALLELLQERPMHGYEMMKALEERSHGLYVPSPGSIYPTLQLLEDRELVTVQEVEGKKVYSITDAGRSFLGERRSQEEEEFAGPPWMRGFNRAGRRWNEPEMQALRTEAMEVARLFAIAGRKSFNDPKEVAALRAIMERTRKELSDMIYESGSSQTQEPSAQEMPRTENA